MSFQTMKKSVIALLSEGDQSTKLWTLRFQIYDIYRSRQTLRDSKRSVVSEVKEEGINRLREKDFKALFQFLPASVGIGLCGKIFYTLVFVSLKLPEYNISTEIHNIPMCTSFIFLANMTLLYFEW